jgi:hypothetical protein
MRMTLPPTARPPPRPTVSATCPYVALDVGGTLFSTLVYYANYQIETLDINSVSYASDTALYISFVII